MLRYTTCHKNYLRSTFGTCHGEEEKNLHELDANIFKNQEETDCEKTDV